MDEYVLILLELSVSIRLSETGIKFVDLLTPYKSGGKWMNMS